MNNQRTPLMEHHQEDIEDELLEITAGDLSLDDLIDEQLDVIEEEAEVNEKEAELERSEEKEEREAVA